jgi:ERCC4-related helicase
MKDLLEALEGCDGGKHPKIQILQEIVLDHFTECVDPTTRVIVFVELRDVVTQIVNTLENFAPVVKPSQFIGQAGGKGKGKGKIL